MDVFFWAYKGVFLSHGGSSVVTMVVSIPPWLRKPPSMENAICLMEVDRWKIMRYHVGTGNSIRSSNWFPVFFVGNINTHSSWKLPPKHCGDSFVLFIFIENYVVRNGCDCNLRCFSEMISTKKTWHRGFSHQKKDMFGNHRCVQATEHVQSRQHPEDLGHSRQNGDADQPVVVTIWGFHPPLHPSCWWLNH